MLGPVIRQKTAEHANNNPHKSTLSPKMAGSRRPRRSHAVSVSFIMRNIDASVLWKDELPMMPNLLAEANPESAYQRMMFFRSMSPATRLEFTWIMTDAEFKRRRSEIRDRNPEYTDDQVRLAEIRDRLGDELFQKAYPGAHFPDAV